MANSAKGEKCDNFLSGRMGNRTEKFFKKFSYTVAVTAEKAGKKRIFDKGKSFHKMPENARYRLNFYLTNKIG